MAKVGDRVGAICEANEKGVKIFGYGVYQGPQVPPPGIKFMGMDMNKLGHKNPQIMLDNGKVVYGCECWWGSEEEAKKAVDHWKGQGAPVTEVDIDEYRKEAANG